MSKIFVEVILNFTKVVKIYQTWFIANMIYYSSKISSINSIK